MLEFASRGMTTLKSVKLLSDYLNEHRVTKNCNPRQCTIEMAKIKRILTKFRVLGCEYICDRIAKFHKKILFITRVINIQILMTKYFSFQYTLALWMDQRMMSRNLGT